MATTFPLASPVQFGLASVEWGPLANTALARNPWTFADALQVFAGRMWVGRLAVLPQTGADARGLTAWLTSLDGRRGTFLLGDPGAAAPLGSAKDTPGTPVVDGGGQSGATLAVRGLPAGATGYLTAGDYLQLGSGSSARLFMALADVDADGAGEATIDIWPSLRTSPADGAAVVVSGAAGVFRLAAPIAWQERQGSVYDGVTLAVEEVVP